MQPHDELRQKVAEVAGWTGVRPVTFAERQAMYYFGDEHLFVGELVGVPPCGGPIDLVPFYTRDTDALRDVCVKKMENDRTFGERFFEELGRRVCGDHSNKEEWTGVPVKLLLAGPKVWAQAIVSANERGSKQDASNKPEQSYDSLLSALR